MHTISKVPELERVNGVTWSNLAGLEPQLAELLWEARAAGAGCQDWEDARRVFMPFRDAVGELVGLRGRHRSCPILGSVGAYEVAYWRLHEAVAGLLPRLATSAVMAREEGVGSVFERERSAAQKPQTATGNMPAAVGKGAMATARALLASMVAMFGL